MRTQFASSGSSRFSLLFVAGLAGCASDRESSGSIVDQGEVRDARAAPRDLGAADVELSLSGETKADVDATNPQDAHLPADSVDTTVLSPARYCDAFRTANNGLWVTFRMADDPEPVIRIKIGGGGAIERLQAASTGPVTSGDWVDLLYPDGAESPTTDRVVQAAVWSKVYAMVPSTGTPAWWYPKRYFAFRWNMNQAGDRQTNYAKTHRVDLDETRCAFSIWSSQQRQWRGHTDFSGRMDSMVRYSWLADKGALKMQRHIYFKQMRHRGRSHTLGEVRVDSWMPWSAAQLSHISADDTETDIFEQLRGNQQRDVDHPSLRQGYLILHSATAERPAVGIVYGGNRLPCNSSCPGWCGCANYGADNTAWWKERQREVLNDDELFTVCHDHSNYTVPACGYNRYTFYAWKAAGGLYAHPATNWTGVPQDSMHYSEVYLLPRPRGGISQRRAIKAAAVELAAIVNSPLLIKTGRVPPWAEVDYQRLHTQGDRGAATNQLVGQEAIRFSGSYSLETSPSPGQ